jgi:hypothetical protein
MYIKKSKTKYKIYKPFLTLNQNPKPNKKYSQSKKKDLKTKTILKVLCLFTKKSANAKI